MSTLAAPSISPDDYPYVDFIMESLKVSSWMITDESALSDFTPTGQDVGFFLSRMANRWGIPIDRGNTNLGVIVKALKDKYPNPDLLASTVSTKKAKGKAEFEALVDSLPPLAHGALAGGPVRPKGK